MSKRFVTGQMDSHTSTNPFAKTEPSITENEEEELGIGSWLTLYQGDGPPRTAIRCFEPKPKRAEDLKKGDVILNNCSACKVLDAPNAPGDEGEMHIDIYDIFSDETTIYITDDEEEITLVATSQTRYLLRDVPSAEHIPGTLVLQKQDCQINENPETVFKLPGGRLSTPLRSFFNMARIYDMPITLLLYEVMGRFQLVAFGITKWDAFQ